MQCTAPWAAYMCHINSPCIRWWYLKIIWHCTSCLYWPAVSVPAPLQVKIHSKELGNLYIYWSSPAYSKPSLIWSTSAFMYRTQWCNDKPQQWLICLRVALWIECEQPASCTTSVSSKSASLSSSSSAAMIYIHVQVHFFVSRLHGLETGGIWAFP